MENKNLSQNLNFSASLKDFAPSLLYLLFSLPLGMLYFTAVIAGVSLGAGTLIIYIGIPLLAFTLVAAKGFVNFDKILASKLLNQNICLHPMDSFQAQDGKGFIRNILDTIKHPRNWSYILYCIVKLPIGILNFTVAITLTVLSLGFLLSPVLYAVLKFLDLDILISNDIFYILGVNIPQSAQAGITFILGVFISYLTVNIVNVMAKKSAEATLKLK